MHAVRRRIDGTDVLRLARTDPGCEASVLSDGRGRLLAGAAALRLWDRWLTGCRDRPRVTARGRPRPDATHRLAAGRALHRIEGGGDTRRHALHARAVVAPEGWQAVRQPAWRARDTRRAEEERLPTTQAARAALALSMGHEGGRLRAAIEAAETARWLRAVPAVASLRRGWRQHDWGDGTPRQGRAADHLPPAAWCIRAPADPEAPDARQPPTPGVGDTVPLTATCDDELPPLLTTVDPTSGPEADGAATPRIHAARQQRGRRPGTPSVDTGCLDAALLGERQANDGVAWLGPTRLDSHGQARAGAGFDAPHVPSDGAPPPATCPAGTPRLSWTPAIDHREHPGLQVQCARTDGRHGDPRTHGRRAQKRAPRRPLTSRPPPHTRRSRGHGTGKQRRRFRRRRHAAPAAQGRARARHAAGASDGHATSASSACTWDTASPPWGCTCGGAAHGAWRPRVPRPVSRRSPGGWRMALPPNPRRLRQQYHFG